MLRVTKKDGEEFPVLYRGAWYDYQRRRWVCYPVGIHWIAWAVRWLWMWTYRQMRPDAWERACGDIRDQVRQESRADWEHTESEWRDHLAELRADRLRLLQENKLLIRHVEELRMRLIKVATFPPLAIQDGEPIYADVRYMGPTRIEVHCGQPIDVTTFADEGSDSAMGSKQPTPPPTPEQLAATGGKPMSPPPPPPPKDDSHWQPSQSSIDGVQAFLGSVSKFCRSELDKIK